MANLTIGIISKDKIINGKVYECIDIDNLKHLNNKCNYIGIIPNFMGEYINTDVIDKCDGIIFPGGSDIYPYHFKILAHAIKNNIPVLGICMGMQLIGLYANNQQDCDLLEIDNHLNTNHKILINNSSLFHKLYGSGIEVNSRHKFCLSFVNEPFIVGAKSEDGVIEEIEYIDSEHFVIGCQFHPENLDNMDGLYNYFLRECLARNSKN